MLGVEATLDTGGLNFVPQKAPAEILFRLVYFNHILNAERVPFEK